MWDQQELVAKIWKRMEGFVPELHHRFDGAGDVLERRMKMTRLNERMGFLKYEEGEHFEGKLKIIDVIWLLDLQYSAHPDCYYQTEDGRERSYITVLLFLNDQAIAPGESEFVGGAITFHSQDMESKLDIAPKTGRLLLFEQEHLLHSGQQVSKGVKYAMRTDLMYGL
ncbi:hypothetical protein K491DRAFT_594626 [Lophiostoma macrostomum CBS 122681]|uniref:Prolyl 4-hydroxylase alpha subunit Fe(2+) 2OG dioxygenase domain-containing protein n=1 Tax=Lophiostoma macrostomum CBS 122681 TaxID=1314788 RepID=A0A6A6TFE8_9PLEO|nr:hypothetical protein K491DRAFT_594626 [Lophiostoma macrostomum CBS 122681]